ncbi:rhodanese-like domain-containing protein [Flavobacterium sp. PL002]|uniref:rhodanese-like domain-containing protein n=1 Tax=Flavobacterium sp. PL002 TaxID=1897058 RepID=UPI0019ED14B7|nr:rhodanese-like domain-containing protein [Flavobacterium sp. PL002]MBE0393843.1 Thiosulfate sulfurtransferase PspE [Flavobacterium sp. PL002]
MKNNMRVQLIIISFFFSIAIAAQSTIPKVLKLLNKESVPYIMVDALNETDKFVFLDARELNEYNVSHIKNAVFIGYDHFENEKVTTIIKDKNTPIVVYCSIGVRSENIGEKLQKLGYTKVFNLYGGIFEYKNKGRKVVNNQNKETDSVHTFNKKWSKYLTKGKKIYEN